MDGVIETIVSELDTQTKALGTDRSLALMGDGSSRYLRTVARKAEQLGISTVWWRSPGCQRSFADRLVEPVWDNQCRSLKKEFEALIWAGCADLDNVLNDRLSCCAQACSMTLAALPPTANTLVTISGRGHARQGLARDLMESGYSAFEIHSETPARLVSLAAAAADIIVNTSEATVWPEPEKYWPQIVIDTVGNLGRFKGRCRYIGPGDIGALNASLLLHRLAKLGRR